MAKPSCILDKEKEQKEHTTLPDCVPLEINSAFLSLMRLSRLFESVCVGGLHVCVCVCVCVSVCSYVCVWEGEGVIERVCAYACVCASVCAFACVCAGVCAQAY